MPKRRTTTQIDAQMLELLKSRRTEKGSVSQQFEKLARSPMLHESDLKTLEEQHRLGNERRPEQGGKFMTLTSSSLNP